MKTTFTYTCAGGGFLIRFFFNLTFLLIQGETTVEGKNPTCLLDLTSEIAREIKPVYLEGNNYSAQTSFADAKCAYRKERMRPDLSGSSSKISSGRDTAFSPRAIPF